MLRGKRGPRDRPPQGLPHLHSSRVALGSPQRCADSTFTVLAELRKCGLTDTESCLKAVTLSLSGGDMVRLPCAAGWERQKKGAPE